MANSPQDDLDNVPEQSETPATPGAPDESTDPQGDQPKGKGKSKPWIWALLGLLVAGGGGGAAYYFLVVQRAPEPPPPVAADLPPPLPPLPEGPWERFTLDDAQRVATDKVNAAAPEAWVLVGPNKVDPALAKDVPAADAPLVTVKLPGKDAAGQPQALVLRLPTAQSVVKIAAAVKEETGLSVRVRSGWRSNAEHADLKERAPGLAALSCLGSHFVDGIDIARQDAEGKEPLTLGTDGKVIFLEDLASPEGVGRFKDVVRKIEKDALAALGKKANKKKEDAILEPWVKSAAQDYANGVWGVQDATMEVWRKNGWTVGHCGESPYRSWHAQPIGAVTTCERWDDTYNKRIRQYRQTPAASEESQQRALEMAAAKDGPEPYLLDGVDLARNTTVNMTLPPDYDLIAFNRVSPKVAGKVEDADAPLVYVKLPGKDRSGAEQRLLARQQTADMVNTVAKEVREKMGLSIRANFIWRDNFTQQRLFDSMPKGYAAKPGSSNHFVNAMDLSRKEASGKDALTLDTEGKIIFLEDLDKPEGVERFKKVVEKINAKELKKANAKKKAKLLADWVKNAKRDYDNGVWGMSDVTMEVWRAHGWTTGHCGELDNESWHTEPISKMKKCERWDDTYNARLLKYAKHPPMPEDKQWELMAAILAKPADAAPPKKAAKKGCKGLGCALNNAIKGVKGMFGK